jgi:outer membrane protein
MKKIVALCFAALTLLIMSSPLAFAQFAPLADEFLKGHSEVMINELNHTSIKLAFDAVEADKRWSFNLGLGHNEDQLDRNNPFFEPTNRNFLNGGLARNFSWGGTLMIDGRYEEIDEQPAQSSLLVAEDNYQFAQGFSYTQDLGKDFFGRKYFAQREAAFQRQQFSQTMLTEKNEHALFQFYVSYLKASLRKTNVKLQKAAEERSKRRREDVAKKVKDGLKDKVDLYEAEIFLLNTQEGVRESEKLLQNDLYGLSQALSRKVELQEIEEYVLTQPAFVDFNRQPNADQNATLKRMDEEVKLAHAELKTSVYDFNPDVKLTTEYRTNDFDLTRKTAIENGQFGQDQNFWQVSVNLTIPLDFEVEKIRRAQSKIVVMTKEIEHKKTAESYHFQKENLKNQLSLQQKNILAALEKREYALLAVKSHNQLYNLGRHDLDRLIRAEESLIQTETSLATTISQYLQLSAEWAKLNGNLLVEWSQEKEMKK